MSLMPIPIGDPDDPRIEPFRNIRERDLVGRGGLIAEGAVVLDELLKSQFFRPTALMVLRSRLDGLMPRLSSLPADVPLYVVERELVDTVAGFPVHRGILAHAERIADAPLADPTVLAARNALVVVAAGIANHDNMGAIFRSASAFGADAVFIDETACDPLYRKAIRVSVGSILTLPFERLGTVRSIHGRLADAGFDCVALSPQAATRLDRWRPDGPTALFLGAEGPGLPHEILSKMTAVRIAMTPRLDSLNVAMAASIALHHAFAWRQG